MSQPDTTTTPTDPRPSPTPARRLKKRIQAAIALTMGVGLVRAWGGSLRILARGDDELRQLRGPTGGPLLYALGHGSCFAPFYHWRDRGVCVMTSQSPDGQMLSRGLRRLGFLTVSGSSSRGGTQALTEMADAVRAGNDACITVDGPTGPRGVAKRGIILLARLTGRPVIPVVCAPSSCWQFQSWDRFRLPLPFARVLLVVGDPLLVAPDAADDQVEACRLCLEQTLATLQQRADDEMHPRVWRLPDRNPRDRPKEKV